MKKIKQVGLAVLSVCWMAGCSSPTDGAAVASPTSDPGAVAASLLLSSISPSTGPISGGITLTISGTAFTAGMSVTVGGSACLSLTIQSSTQATCQVPSAGGAGAQAVQVSLGSQQAQLTAAFTYIAPPAVSSVTPTQGVVTGSTSIHIFGTAFQSGATVLIGSAACGSITFISATEIDCVTPAGSGIQAIQITNPDAQAGSLAAAFTYDASLFINAVSPQSGAPAGGTLMTITGGGFIVGAAIKINGIACTTTLDSGTQVHCTTSAQAAGAYSVTVTSAAQTVTATQTFRYALATALSSTSGDSTVTCAILSDTSINCWGGTVGEPISILNPAGTASLTGVIQVSVGGAVACATLSNGQAVCWGDNTYGALGVNDTAVHANPVTVLNGASPLTGITKIVTDGLSTCALLSTQKALCWGAGGRDTGTGTNPTITNGKAYVLTTDNATPMTFITDLAMLDNTSACFVRNGGTVYCSGWANGTTTPTLYPLFIPLAGVGTNMITSIAMNAGMGACVSSLTNNTVYCWEGTNGVTAALFGSAGDGPSNAAPAAYDTIVYGTNPYVSQLSQGDATALCGLFSDGSVKCAGIESAGRLGNDAPLASSTCLNTFAPVLDPAGTGNLTSITSLSGSCALNSSGTVYCWGPAAGLGNSNSPSQLPNAGSSLPVQVSAWQ